MTGLDHVFLRVTSPQREGARECRWSCLLAFKLLDHHVPEKIKVPPTPQHTWQKLTSVVVCGVNGNPGGMLPLEVGPQSLQACVFTHTE